jgi:hypothetical protein
VNVPSHRFCSSRWRVIAAMSAIPLLATPELLALTPLAAIRTSADVTVELGAVSGPDETVFEDNLLGTVTPLALGAIPGEADVTAYHRRDDGQHLLVFETVTTLPGGLVVGPADVVRFDGASFFLELAAASAGIPAGPRIDALTQAGDGGLVVSFDVDTTLGALAVGDSDLVRIGGGPASMWLAAVSLGIGNELDVDAVDRLPNGNLLFSFETGGSLAGLTFADEDVLEVDPAGPSWELALAGATLHGGWSTADLDALWALPGGAGPLPPAGVLRFSSALYFENETAPFALITVERIGGSSGDVSVSYFSADLTATAGLDYQAVAAQLFWLDGDASPKQFQVPLIDDPDQEGPEEVRLVLTGPTGGAALGDPAIATLTIGDDETPSVLEIPTLGTWGALGLALLLGLLGAITLRRSRGGPVVPAAASRQG